MISHSFAYEASFVEEKVEQTNRDNEQWAEESPEKIIRDYLFEYYNRGSK